MMIADPRTSSLVLSKTLVEAYRVPAWILHGLCPAHESFIGLEMRDVL